MNIYLIRHGEMQPGGAVDSAFGLSCLGVFQAKCLGSRLTQYQIEKIYTSEDTVAVQTADIINRYLAVELEKSPDLREIDMGSFVRGWEFLNEFHPHFSEKYAAHTEDVPYPGGENGADVMRRAGKVIDEILETGSQNVAVVTHTGTISALISGILGLDQARRFFVGSPIEHCSISILNHEKKSGQMHIHTINDYAHLDFLRPVK
jgi:probable phosphoglycerate mutase